MTKVFQEHDCAALTCLVITADEDFFTRLATLARRCGWRLMRAASAGDVEDGKNSAIAGIPLVVYDPQESDGDWREVVRRLHNIRGEPCVLLASVVSDDPLVREVVGNQGYDVLPKRASEQKLEQSLNFAWLWARRRI